MHTRKLMLLAATFVFVIVVGQTVSAQRGNWVYLGDSTVNGDSDHDKIKVGDKKGGFRALQIRVERAAIDFQYVLVHYDNGGDDRLPLQGRVLAGGSSRVLDLRGGTRIIKSVEVWYSKGNWAKDKKPKMLLYGRY